MNKQLKWDLYFLEICKTVSLNSKCLSRKIGAILVKDKAIVSTGYNGSPRKVKHCNERDIEFYNWLDNNSLSKRVLTMDNEICPRRIFSYRSGEGLFMCSAGHAERNALIQAARNGISSFQTTLYCSCPLPCKECCIELINAGVERVVCFKGKDYDKYSRILLEEAGILLEEIDEKLLEEKW